MLFLVPRMLAIVVDIVIANDVYRLAWIFMYSCDFQRKENVLMFVTYCNYYLYVFYNFMCNVIIYTYSFV